jgi:hypothetical protein
MPFVSVEPNVVLAVNHEGILIEKPTVPVDALTRYWYDVGENGPP